MSLDVERTIRFKAEAERDEFREALLRIAEDEGRVCGEPDCSHEACRSSFAAWAIADRVLGR